MRTFVLYVRQFRSAFQHRRYSFLSDLSRRQKVSVNWQTSGASKPLHNAGIARYLLPVSMVTRIWSLILQKIGYALEYDLWNLKSRFYCGIVFLHLGHRIKYRTENQFNAWYIKQTNCGIGAPKFHSKVKEVSRAGPLVEYDRRIAEGELVDGDNCQVGTLRELQRLYDDLVMSADACSLDRYTASEKAGRSRWLWSRFIPQSSYSPVKGLYLYGGVGTGKTMLMDLFFNQLQLEEKKDSFHDFMLVVHSRLQRHKGVADPLEVVAGEISDEAILLCLDEFMVTDVADALILNRLFGHLFSNGCILVSTSNRAPDKLYEGGLQRDLFLPFISTLKAEQGFFFIEKDASGLVKQKFQHLIGEHTAVPQEVEVVMGRKLQIPLGANGCAYFPFEDLCDKPLGAADYFGLFKKFHTLALEGVPIFGLHNRTAAYRFVTLVDDSSLIAFKATPLAFLGDPRVISNVWREPTASYAICLVMYENKARLLCTAEGSPLQLFERL
ncbi:AFG1-like ATPase [Vitis vinifera]|uniref:AFG1-like ATPase n=1 Tax=Vitis vinifera TaxID=29760 RepID=A0A438HJR0_VITVI|nr:AFG1-like ATPase [Vitis vinifera]